jgi:hypothetical protein
MDDFPLSLTHLDRLVLQVTPKRFLGQKARC